MQSADDQQIAQLIKSVPTTAFPLERFVPHRDAGQRYRRHGLSHQPAAKLHVIAAEKQRQRQADSIQHRQRKSKEPPTVVMPRTRFEERQQIVGPVQAVPARLIDADPFGQITAAGLDELARPEAIEHVSADGQVAAGQGQKRRRTQHRFRLRKDVVVHQQDMRRRPGALRFEKTAREPAGPAEVVLLDKLQALGSYAHQGGEGGVVAHFFPALIDDNDALQDLSDIRIGKKSTDVADEQGRTVERANAGTEPNRPSHDRARRPFRLVHDHSGRISSDLEEQQAEARRCRPLLRQLDAQLSIVAGEIDFFE
jgi:hypothetical protein